MVQVQKPIRKDDMITEWLLDTRHRWKSSHGKVTNRQWLQMEEARIPGSKFVEKGQMLGLAKAS